jgi:hypothetical protein
MMWRRVMIWTNDVERGDDFDGWIMIWTSDVERGDDFDERCGEG